MSVSADPEPPKLSRGGSDGKVVRGEPPRVADLEDEGIASDEEDELGDGDETLAERLIGLTEMVPDRVWNFTGKTLRFSYWFVRRSAWVIGTSLALLVLPTFIEQQRMEMEEMQSMQKKQMLLGQGAIPPGTTPRPMT